MDRIATLINNGEYEKAKQELEEYKKQNKKYNDQLAILEATIAISEDRLSDAFVCLREGIAYNHVNYEIYFTLGNLYEHINPNQAYLCYENAYFYCDNEDRDFIQRYMAEYRITQQIEVAPTAIIILSYNTMDLTKQCIESIRATNLRESYEIIVIDNNSSDQSVSWLKKQEDIVLVCNETNVGFPAGCNQGARLAKPENNILLLNSDTIVPDNALFWLRMGLYENNTVGATGSISNNVTNYQQVEENDITDKTYHAIAKRYNILSINPYEKKSWLVGFCMLIKRNVWEEVGFLDERFTPGNYEDTDYGFRIIERGYTNLLCKNSFVFHYGGSGFNKNRSKYLELLRKNREQFTQKWGLDPGKYTAMDTSLLSLLPQSLSGHANILCIGCGCGAILSRMKYLYPDAKLYGIDKNETAAKIASYMYDVTCVDIEEYDWNHVSKTFDVIIIGGLLEKLENPSQLLTRLKEHLGETGMVLGSVHNSMYYELLNKDTVEEKKGYTLEELIEIAKGASLVIRDFFYRKKENGTTDEDNTLLEQYAKKTGLVKEILEAYEFYFQLI